MIRFSYLTVIALAALACGGEADGERRGSAGGGISPECSYEELSPTAKWQNMTDFADGASKPFLFSSFSDGRMSSLDGVSCKLVPALTFSNAPCNDQYDCGGCFMLVRRNSEGTWIMDLTSPKDGPCDHVYALYFGTRSSSGGGGGGNDCNFSECLQICVQAGGTNCGEDCKC
jgi:hypothetical protein